MTSDIFNRVAHWYCNGLPESGLTTAERGEVIESAQCSYLAEHVVSTEEELQTMDGQHRHSDPAQRQGRSRPQPPGARRARLLNT